MSVKLPSAYTKSNALTTPEASVSFPQSPGVRDEPDRLRSPVSPDASNRQMSPARPPLHWAVQLRPSTGDPYGSAPAVLQPGGPFRKASLPPQTGHQSAPATTFLRSTSAPPILQPGGPYQNALPPTQMRPLSAPTTPIRSGEQSRRQAQPYHNLLGTFPPPQRASDHYRQAPAGPPLPSKPPEYGGPRKAGPSLDPNSDVAVSAPVARHGPARAPQPVRSHLPGTRPPTLPMQGAYGQKVDDAREFNRANFKHPNIENTSPDALRAQKAMNALKAMAEYAQKGAPPAELALHFRQLMGSEPSEPQVRAAVNILLQGFMAAHSRAPAFLSKTPQKKTLEFALKETAMADTRTFDETRRLEDIIRSMVGPRENAPSDRMQRYTE